jgi:pantoate--beta-alanine ligase
MFVASDPAAIRIWSRARAADGVSVGFVPTMGALHHGHLTLVDEARRRSGAVVVSIFVNPLQFDRAADFDGYPRPLDDDLDLCRMHGVDAVYAPTAATMYPPGFQTHVVPGALAEVLEGAARPGHFRGVATVVSKLFGAVEPHVAVFGEKDFQQLAVIRRMTADLDLGVEIVGVPTVRETDGVATSSRNSRLSDAQRAAAVCVPRALDAVRAALAAGAVDPEVLAATARAVVDAEPLARFEHLDIIDRDTLQPVGRVEQGGAVAVTAVWFGDVRLIDNVRL